MTSQYTLYANLDKLNVNIQRTDKSLHSVRQLGRHVVIWKQRLDVSFHAHEDSRRAQEGWSGLQATGRGFLEVNDTS